jgi:hypothetical protein
MLHEGMNAKDPDQDRWEFFVTTNDVAHWAGIAPEKVRTVINQFVTQHRVELFPYKIVVLNIRDLQRLVSSRRRDEE